MNEEKPDKLQKRYEVLDRLIELLSHGEAKVVWCDKKIIRVEEIDAKESKVIE